MWFSKAPKCVLLIGTQLGDGDVQVLCMPLLPVTPSSPEDCLPERTITEKKPSHEIIARPTQLIICFMKAGTWPASPTIVFYFQAQWLIQAFLSKWLLKK